MMRRPRGEDITFLYAPRSGASIVHITLMEERWCGSGGCWWYFSHSVRSN